MIDRSRGFGYGSASGRSVAEAAGFLQRLHSVLYGHEGGCPDVGHPSAGSKDHGDRGRGEVVGEFYDEDQVTFTERKEGGLYAAAGCLKEGPHDLQPVLGVFDLGRPGGGGVGSRN